MPRGNPCKLPTNWPPKQGDSRSFRQNRGDVFVRSLSKIAPDWWDYTTLDREILDDAARLSADDLLGLGREGFAVKFYDTLEDFYLAEALEYITAWQQATARPAGRHLRSDRPHRAVAAGGPAGERTESESAALPFLGHGRMGHRRPRGAREFSVELRAGRPGAVLQPHSARAADAASGRCTFPESIRPPYSRSFDQARCVVMQGGQGEVKHWAFNDPPRRQGPFQDAPPSPADIASWARGWSSCTR